MTKRMKEKSKLRRGNSEGYDEHVNDGFVGRTMSGDESPARKRRKKKMMTPVPIKCSFNL
jgi:hypothetical protein